MSRNCRPVLIRWLSLSIRFLLILTCIGGLSAQAAGPATMSYQGYLTSSSGTAVSGNFTVIFRLYDAVTGGTSQWQETQSVSVANGVYSVTLGAVTPIALPFNIPYYLDINVNGEQLNPRQALSSVGYAFSAATVNDGAITSAKLADPFKVGNSAVVCNTGNAGAIRWSGSRFEGCNGTGWIVFSTSFTCSDGLRNGNETDVDCGGSCGSTCGIGKICSSNPDCSSGNCSAGVCAAPLCNTATDPNNCGTCGHVCVAANGNASCTAGICGVASCNAGFADCDGIAANGCETNTNVSVNNCGTCGHVCAGTQACVSGVCQ